MFSYYLPDITGKNPNYLQVNIPFNVYAKGVPFDFESSPVFLSSLRIALTDGTSLLLEKEVDWKINTSDVDHTAMSRAYLENPDFNDILVKSVTFISDRAVKKVVAISFQEFYLTNPGRVFDDGRPFEFSPAIAKSLVAGLADVRQQVARVYSPVTPALTAPRVLAFDINGEIKDNIISDEIVSVNTIAGGKIIRLAQGAFFPDSLKLKFGERFLNEKTDYLPIVASPLLKNTTNKSGIFQYILITNNEISGQIKATYHAVGGEVQVDDFNSLKDQMVAIVTFLNEGIFITSETVSETPAFRALSSRYTELEQNVRKLLSGAPTYGDQAIGGATLRPIAATDAQFHWWSIASLYKVEGSNDIVTADQFKGRVFFPGAKVSLAFTVDVNLEQTRNPVSFKTDNLVFDPTYTLFGDTSAAAPVYPMVRVVWSRISQSISGAVIQIGIPLTALSDRMVVENLSSQESCWLLDHTGEFITGNPVVAPTSPRDNNFLLPDGSTTWSSTTEPSKQCICVPNYDLGYLVYSGSNVNLKQTNVNTSTTSLFNVPLPSYFPVHQAKSLLLTLESADKTQTYEVEVVLPRVQTNTKIGRVSFVDTLNGFLTLSAVLKQEVNGTISLALNTVNQTPANNAMTDVIRYVRVKV